MWKFDHMNGSLIEWKLQYGENHRKQKIFKNTVTCHKKDTRYIIQKGIGFNIYSVLLKAIKIMQ